MTASKTGAENKISALEQKEQELQAFIQQLSMDLQKVSRVLGVDPGFMNGVETKSFSNFCRRMAAETSVSHAALVALVPGLARLYSHGNGHTAEQKR